MNLLKSISKERDLRMIWKVSKNGRQSLLAGTAHFFPYSFKKSLTNLMQSAETVLLEGLLDQEAIDKVTTEGSNTDPGFSLRDLLDARTIKAINKLESSVTNESYRGTYNMVFGRSNEKSLLDRASDKKPWMAFFSIWYYFRLDKGWAYTMDIDALNIAKKLGKEIHFLETIDEQISALNGVPAERVANFLAEIGNWDKYARRYSDYYLKGDLSGLLSFVTDFPTFCEAVIDKRDPVLYGRMKPYLEKGGTIAAVGITHIKGLREILIKDGFALTQL